MNAPPEVLPSEPPIGARLRSWWATPACDRAIHRACLLLLSIVAIGLAAGDVAWVLS